MAYRNSSPDVWEGRQSTGLSDFLQEVSLLSDLDEDESDRTTQSDIDDDSLGQRVGVSGGILVGMEENLFPSPRDGKQPTQHWKKNVVFFMWLLPVPNVIVL